MEDQNRRLRRIPAQGKIAGICAGLAAYVGVDVTVVRLAWIVLSIVPGAFIGGIVAYAAAWLIMPEDSTVSSQDLMQRRLRRSSRDAKIAGVCGGIAEYLDIDSTVVRLAWAVLTIVPGGIVLGVVVYAGAWLIMPPAVAPLMQSALSTP
jgi:phage shock protein PspC (stress-responsive transcriptional regulator)